MFLDEKWAKSTFKAYNKSRRCDVCVGYEHNKETCIAKDDNVVSAIR